MGEVERAPSMGSHPPGWMKTFSTDALGLPADSPLLGSVSPRDSLGLQEELQGNHILVCLWDHMRKG